MFKKSIPDKVIDIFMSHFTSDADYIKAFSIYTFFCTRTVDHKTYFWTKGVINTLVETLSKLLTDYNEGKQDQIECITLALYHLSIDNSKSNNNPIR